MEELKRAAINKLYLWGVLIAIPILAVFSIVYTVEEQKSFLGIILYILNVMLFSFFNNQNISDKSKKDNNDFLILMGSMGIIFAIVYILLGKMIYSSFLFIIFSIFSFLNVKEIESEKPKDQASKTNKPIPAPSFTNAYSTKRGTSTNY